jgi:hypothetical protein
LFPDVTGPSYDISAIDFFGVILFSQVVETLLMVPIFLVIKIFTKKLIPVCIISAAIWALLHSAMYPLWGVTTFISFFIFSVAFQSWGSASNKNSIFVVIVIHMLNNATAFTAMVLDKYIS